MYDAIRVEVGKCCKVWFYDKKGHFRLSKASSLELDDIKEVSPCCKLKDQVDALLVFE